MNEPFLHAKTRNHEYRQYTSAFSFLGPETRPLDCPGTETHRPKTPNHGQALVTDLWKCKERSLTIDLSRRDRGHVRRPEVGGRPVPHLGLPHAGWQRGGRLGGDDH